eukprot:2502875-Pyramimonas_sp.AAC.1
MFHIRRRAANIFAGRVEKRAYAAFEAREATLYELLGVERDATTEDIKKAFIRQAKELHPDTQQGEIDRDAFVRLVTAREV